jgi:uncharacterized membrane protein YfcA
MLILLLFFTGLFAGTVDAIAGGGGLISVPILLSTGMPPHIVLGTNKLQSSIGTLMAAINYHRHGLVSFKSVMVGLFFGVLGASAGAIVSQLISGDVLRKIVPFILFVILIYTIFTPKLGHQDEQPRMRAPIFFSVFGFLLSFYDGFFGPGTGSFWVFLITFFLGFNLIKATAYTKIFNLNSNFVSLICFAIGGNIDYRLGFCMAAGQLIGGYVGAHLAIKKGARFVRPFFLAIVTITILSLLYKVFFT